MASKEYDRGWIEGSEAQNTADHELIIEPLTQANKQLQAEVEKQANHNARACNLADKFEVKNKQLQAKVKRYEEALVAIAANEDYAFAECTVAEFIMETAKQALKGE